MEPDDGSTESHPITFGELHSMLDLVLSALQIASCDTMQAFYAKAQKSNVFSLDQPLSL
jgi:hypothetical protein